MRNSKKYKSINELEKALYDKWGDRYSLVDTDNIKSIRVTDKIKVKCNKCGNVSEKYISTILDFGCKFCCNGDIRHFRTNEELKNYVKNITNGEYELISDHCKTRDKAKFRHNSDSCKNPNKIFEMKIHGFITLGHRCPYCNALSLGSSNSKGNKIIKKYLDNKNIKYYQEYAFNECRSKNANRLLYFDFYLPDNNIIIEFDGQQHRTPVKYFGGEKAFEILQEHDTIKNEFCKKNNINIIRIYGKSYLSEKLLFEELDKYFN